MAKVAALKKPEADKGRSWALVQQPMETDAEFGALMMAIIADVRLGHVTPQIGNAMFNGAGKLLRILDLKHRYGKAINEGGPKTLLLATKKP